MNVLYILFYITVIVTGDYSRSVVYPLNQILKPQIVDVITESRVNLLKSFKDADLYHTNFLSLNKIKRILSTNNISSITTDNSVVLQKHFEVSANSPIPFEMFFYTISEPIISPYMLDLYYNVYCFLFYL